MELRVIKNLGAISLNILWNRNIKNKISQQTQCDFQGFMRVGRGCRN